MGGVRAVASVGRRIFLFANGRFVHEQLVTALALREHTDTGVTKLDNAVQEAFTRLANPIPRASPLACTTSTSCSPVGCARARCMWSVPGPDTGKASSAPASRCTSREPVTGC